MVNWFNIIERLLHMDIIIFDWPVWQEYPWFIQKAKSTRKTLFHLVSSALDGSYKSGLNFLNLEWNSAPYGFWSHRSHSGKHFVYIYHFYRSVFLFSWWRHQIETFSTLLAPCAGNSPVIGELPSQSPVTRSFDVFFDLRLNKRLSKHSRRGWFEMPSRSLMTSL